MRRVLAPAALAASFVLLVAVPAAAAHVAGRNEPEIVKIKTDDGQELEGSFYKPASGRTPAVVLLHGAGGDRQQLEPIAARLHKEGFGVLTIDLRGHGGSKNGKPDWATLSEAQRKELWSAAPHDVSAAATWILHQPNIHSTSLSLVGVGEGCALAVRHAKSDENVVCMALLGPNAEDYGFDLRSDIQMLVGVRTYVVTSKDDIQRMALEANAATAGSPYVDVMKSPPKLANPLEDKKLPSQVAQWMADKALPKRGRDGERSVGTR